MQTCLIHANVANKNEVYNNFITFLYTKLIAFQSRYKIYCLPKMFRFKWAFHCELGSIGRLMLSFKWAKSFITLCDQFV